MKASSVRRAPFFETPLHLVFASIHLVFHAHNANIRFISCIFVPLARSPVSLGGCVCVAFENGENQKWLCEKRQRHRRLHIRAARSIARFRFIKYSKSFRRHGMRMKSLFATLLFESFNTYWMPVYCSNTHVGSQN